MGGFDYETAVQHPSDSAVQRARTQSQPTRGTQLLVLHYAVTVAAAAAQCNQYLEHRG